MPNGRFQRKNCKEALHFLGCTERVSRTSISTKEYVSSNNISRIVWRQKPIRSQETCVLWTHQPVSVWEEFESTEVDSFDTGHVRILTICGDGHSSSARQRTVQRPHSARKRCKFTKTRASSFVMTESVCPAIVHWRMLKTCPHEHGYLPKYNRDW